MGKTQIGGNRIADKQIETRHLADSFAIPEKQMTLNFPTHDHQNKEALDIIVNTNPTIAKSLDIKDIILTILEVAEARSKGSTLKNTIDGKADALDVENIIKEIKVAKGDYGTLSEALRVVITDANNIIKSHAGMQSHQNLDFMYSEISDARGFYESLGERLDNIGIGDGSNSGSINVGQLNPWHYSIELEPQQLVVDLPNSYIVGGYNLQVFDGATLMYPGEYNDYIETSTTQIKLTEPLPDGTILRFEGVGSGRLYQWMLYFVSENKQEIITLLDTYTPNMRDLLIYEDGLLLQPVLDYLEVDNRTIKLIEPFNGHSNIAIFKRR